VSARQRQLNCDCTRSSAGSEHNNNGTIDSTRLADSSD
jgi:hypothetical protein